VRKQLLPLLALAVPLAAAPALAAPRTTSYVRMDALVMVFERVSHRNHDTEPYRLTERGDAAMAALRSGIDAACEFYWRHTGGKLLLVPHYRRTREEVQFTDWWLPDSVARAAADRALAGEARKSGDYDTFIALWQTPRYDPAKRWRVDDVWGGGGTVYRFSSWPVENSPAWLMVHEFHHQLDEFWQRSGFEEYAFNHPTGLPWEGASGEHFDVNASILRAWPRDRWPQFKFGKQRAAIDTDGDGLPDRLPDAPFDEQRLKMDPRRADTDRDGLADLDEAMAGIFRGSDPRRPDTDGDGLKDGADPYPLDAIEERIPHSTSPTMPSAARAALPLGKVQTGDLRAVLRGWWNPEGLHLEVAMSWPATVFLALDAQADGRWRGPDNYEMTFPWGGPSQVRVWDARPGYYGFDNESGYKGGSRLVDPVSIKATRGVAHSRDGLNHRLSLFIPRNEATGFTPRPGHRLGLRVDFTHTSRESGSFASLYERWHSPVFVLAGPHGRTPHVERLGGFGRKLPPVTSAPTRSTGGAAE
jgi:hypothetical protein